MMINPITFKIRITVLWLAVMTTCHVMGQEEQKVDKNTARRLAREHDELPFRQRTEMNAILIDSLITARRFMIRAAYVSNPAGDRMLVNQRTNYVTLDSSQVIIQYSLEYLIGGGGLDGFRTTGTVTRFSSEFVGISHDMYAVSATAETATGTFSMFVIISQTGEATATIDGFSPGRLTFHGTVTFVEQHVDAGPF